LSIAIDFTLSNGDPRQPSSLHYLDPNRNQYMQAINSVGNILQFYNSDKQINLYGFGGSVPPYTNRASHCFALNGDIFNPRVSGIPEVLNCYQRALTNIKLYGPTNFSEVINEVNSNVSFTPVTQQN
jgi:vacuolar-type H+-ATPase subunit F/Vma7